MTVAEPSGAGDELLVLNGVDASTGGYLFAPLSVEQLSGLARNIPLGSPEHVKELKLWHQRVAESSFGPAEGVDAQKLEEAGWGVILPADCDPAILLALKPLLDHRRRQAARSNEHYYQELRYRPGESKQQFLGRHGAAPGPAHPDKVPYYLLIVGGPHEIPYSFQYQLDVQYAVGRLDLDSAREHATYAESVVAAEAGGTTLPQRAAFFATENAGDRATALSSGELVAPLAARVGRLSGDWQVTTTIGEGATKEKLVDLLGGDEPARFLFTATHGVGFPAGHPRQLADQGALLCQDWGGPASSKPLSPADYLAAADLGAGRSLVGLVAFHFACFGAGTPQWDDYAHTGDGHRELASRPFGAALPKRLLGHPDGGALAVVGHVDRAWGYSFLWPQAGAETRVYESCLTRLLGGQPIGSSLEYFNERYAELSSDLSMLLEDIEFGKVPDHLELAALWTAHNDARAFAILGDPAVRVVGAGPAVATGGLRPVVTAAAVEPAATGQTVAAGLPPATAPGGDQTVTGDPSSPPAPSAGVPPASAQLGAAGAFDYGLTDTARRLRDRINDALESLGQTLERAVQSVTVLEVSTYVSTDPGAATFDPAERRFTSGADLRAFTRLNLAGDAVLLVPERPEGIDEHLWKLHLDMVAQARTSQRELLGALTSTLGGLLDAVKAI